LRIPPFLIQRRSKQTFCCSFLLVSVYLRFEICLHSTLHVPLTNETRGLIRNDKIRLMKASAYLINTARGEIVDEEAVYSALKEKRLAGAALDVFIQEPLPRNSPLLNLDNVIVTPHMASGTEEAARGMDLLCAENIIRVLRGKRPLYALNLPPPKGLCGLENERNATTKESSSSS